MNYKKILGILTRHRSVSMHGKALVVYTYHGFYHDYFFFPLIKWLTATLFIFSSPTLPFKPFQFRLVFWIDVLLVGLSHAWSPSAGLWEEFAPPSTTPCRWQTLKSWRPTWRTSRRSTSRTWVHLGWKKKKTSHVVAFDHCSLLEGGNEPSSESLDLQCAP